MRSSRKLTALLACALLAGSGAVFTHAAKDEKPPKDAEKKKDAAKKKEKEKEKEGKKSAEAKGGAAGDGKNGKMELPLIPGHDSKGLKIPYFGSGGKLQMIFTIGVASRLDADHVKMADLQVETFDDAGAPEMTIDLPDSVLDLNTRILSSDVAVKISRDDFEITGNQVRFNTQTKQGELAGNVRMLIFDLDEKNASAPQPDAPTPEPAHP